MSIVVVGSIAFDTIKTPYGERQKSLGGAANYFAMAAHFFAKVHMVGIIGNDFPESHLALLEKKGIDIRGIERVFGSSFHWQGEYGADLNNPLTLKTELNVFEHFSPKVPESYRHHDLVFLANIDPELQIHVLQQMARPKISALDTMNFWIERKRTQLMKAISMVDILFINNSEIKSLTGEHNVIKAGKNVLHMGPKIVVIKRGEYGALLLYNNELVHVPAYPVEDVFDPTGAGDTFAGGFLGFLAQHQEPNLSGLRQAMMMGTVMSSFVIERFSFDRMLELDERMIAERKEYLLKIAHLAC